MFSPDDTIVAIATPAGRGGIGVVRVSGPDAPAIATAARSGTRAARATSRDARAHRRRRARRCATTSSSRSFPRPASYTGEDVVEISAHGSPVLLRAIVEAAMDCGARLAEPGEFTFRAYLRRPDRSRAGRSGPGSGRRGDAAAGAGGVRSARRHADDAHPRDRRDAVRSDGAARSVARFSRRGLSLRRAGRARPRRSRR